MNDLERAATKRILLAAGLPEGHATWMTASCPSFSAAVDLATEVASIALAESAMGARDQETEAKARLEQVRSLARRTSR